MTAVPSKECPSPNAFRGKHEYAIAGTPRSADTYYICTWCGNTKPRGPGVFYTEPKK